MKSNAIMAGMLAALMASGAYAETLKMGNEGDYPPFSITNPDGTLTGLEPDLARAVCAKLNAECEIQAMDFRGLIPSLVTGKINVIASQLYPSEERRNAVEMTDAVLENPETWIAAAALDGEITPEFLDGKSIGIIKGAWNIIPVQTYAPNATLKQYDNLAAIKLDLEAGRLDIGTAGRLAAVNNFIDRPDGDNWQLIEPVPELVGDSRFHWAVGKGNVELRDRMNEALNALLEDCSYSEIRKAYFSVPTSSREPANCQ
ncbi:MAG: transporter substrate-binding domain-containing protein [Paracoccus sp. (in: a-proteobacteria)]|nr:transporter substrate-binding domain-containing protein [Paracoccus sp. (in: a-proteobacteria)]